MKDRLSQLLKDEEQAERDSHGRRSKLPAASPLPRTGTELGRELLQSLEKRLQGSLASREGN